MKELNNNLRESFESQKREEIVGILRDQEIKSKEDGGLPDYGFDNVSEDARKNLLNEVGTYELSNGYKIKINATNGSEGASLVNDKGEELLSENIEIYLSSQFNSIKAEALRKKLEKENPQELEELDFNEDERLYWIKYKKGNMMLIERVGKMMREKLAKEKYEKLYEKKEINPSSVGNNKFHAEYDSALSDLLQNTTSLSKAIEIIDKERLGEKDLHPGALYHLSDNVRNAFSSVVEDNLNWIKLEDKKDNPKKKEGLKKIFEKIIKKDFSQILNERVAHRLLVIMSQYLKFE